MNSEQNSPKILIIRLSSFGDIVQAMASLAALRRRFPAARIDWLVRSDNKSILSCSTNIETIWSFDRKDGLKGLIALAKRLRAENYTHVYDAHSNLRSRIVCSFLHPPHFARRGKDRLKRMLLFKFGVNKFSWPFKGMQSFSDPLKIWGVETTTEMFDTFQFTNEQKSKVDELLPQGGFISLVPSAAWPMKRWPLEHWKKLVELCMDKKLILLGGPDDDFLEEIKQIAPEKVTNLAGKLSLAESCYVVSKSQLVVSADTGLLHVADLLGVKALALIGPTAFGFPTNKQVKVLDVELGCRPCTKDGSGKCIQSVYQKCMVDITPERVISEITYP